MSSAENDAGCRLTFGLGSVLAVCSLAATSCGHSGSNGSPAAMAPDPPHAGWYYEHGGQGRLQLCGEEQPLTIENGRDLQRRARAFGLEEDAPVYVRVTGSMGDGRIAVKRVDQFGSPTPVRDCALTGVVIREDD